MNRLLSILTTAACAMTIAAPVGALPLPHDVGGLAANDMLLKAQLGNGGPVGSGPNGTNNGTGGGVAGSGTFGGPGAGTGTTGAGGLPGVARPNGSGGKPNGSKPAPMQANGVRKVQ